MVREVETLTLLLTGKVLTLALLKCLLDTVLRTSLQGNTDFTSLLVRWLQKSVITTSQTLRSQMVLWQRVVWQLSKSFKFSSF